MNDFQLNNVRKLRILELLYDAADEYAKCMNKEYLFVTEFNNCYSGFFFDEDFLHLSGITLSQPGLIPRFFSMCRNRTFRIENIAGVQTHTYKTIIKKLTNLLSLKNFVENRIDGQNLVIDKPSTSTRSFKYALRNNQSRFTLEFDKRNNARSNRNELVAQGSSYERVIFIFRIPICTLLVILPPFSAFGDIIDVFRKGTLLGPFTNTSMQCLAAR